jgi:hypothetical protein
LIGNIREEEGSFCGKLLWKSIVWACGYPPRRENKVIWGHGFVNLWICPEKLIVENYFGP